MKENVLICEVCGAKKKVESEFVTTALCKCGNLMITPEALEKVRKEDEAKDPRSKAMAELLAYEPKDDVYGDSTVRRERPDTLIEKKPEVEREIRFKIYVKNNSFAKYTITKEIDAVWDEIYTKFAKIEAEHDRDDDEYDAMLIGEESVEKAKMALRKITWKAHPDISIYAHIERTEVFIPDGDAKW